MSIRAFTRGNPCPLCNANHSCSRTEDGLHFCHHHRGEEVHGWHCLGISKIGFGMYRREDDLHLPWYKRAINYPKDGARSFFRSDIASVPIAAASSDDGPSDPDKALKIWLDHPARDRQRLTAANPFARRWADELGLPDPSVFEQLETCWLPCDDRNRGDVLCFPERDGQGNIIGYSRRYSASHPGDGRKMAVGRRGILIPLALTPTSFIHDCCGMDSESPWTGPIYLVEGASDTLTLLTMGRNVLGRPSNYGGAEYLIEFLRRLPRPWQDLIVVGENDGKADGKWPGRSGAYGLAKRLADELNLRVRIVFPPHEFKDIRDWFRAELRIARTKKWVRDYSRYAAASWDEHVFHSRDVQNVNAPLRHQDNQSSGTSHEVSPEPKPPPDLSGLSGDRIASCIAAARKRGDIIDPYTEEEAAKEAVIAARADQDRFPCSCPRYLGFLRKSNGIPWIGEVRCEKRSCAGCRQWLDFWEMENAIVRFRSAEQQGLQLFRLECVGAKEWAAIYACILRQGSSFLRFFDGNDEERFIIWSTCFPSGRSRFGGDFRIVSAAEAAEELRTRLVRYFGLDRPISTSHDWKRLPLEERTKDSVFIGRVDEQAVEKIVEIAETVEAIVVPRVPRHRNGSLRRMWDFLRLSGWDASARDHLFGCWFSGEALPFRPGKPVKPAPPLQEDGDDPFADVDAFALFY